jgi:LysM repeat protein
MQLESNRDNDGKRSYGVIFAFTIGGVLLTVSPLHASVLASLTGKVKSIFINNQDEKEEAVVATSQTMTLFKPVVMDASSADVSDDLLTKDQESLSAVSGPLRVSTEEIVFPQDDTISVYEVKKGDTLQDVAKLFNVSVNTIIWGNDLKSRTLVPGTTLLILPITGIKHTVKKGETISTIAKKYKADVGDVSTYNGLSLDASLAVGDTVIVPDGEIEAVAVKKPQVAAKKPKTLATTPSGFLVRPMVGGRKTQGIHGNNAIDIAANQGTPVVASASGRAILAKMGGYNGGYGNLIIINHEKGVQTVYAHLRDIYITQGQTVTQGQVIGEVGNTGRSTGPHLHFEVRGAKNPF